MRDLRTKVVAVTGASSGIGRALAHHLSSLGCHLALCDVDEEGLAETAHGLPHTTTARIDVADREAMFAWAAQVAAEHGGVDAIVNNAGVAVKQTIADCSYDDFEWLMGVNLWGVVHGVKAFMPHLEQRPWGWIVNISSINAMVPFPENGPYNMSKYAVAALSETLHMELVDSTVGVTSVHPGGIETRIAHNARGVKDHEADLFVKLTRTSPDKAARTIVDAMRRQRFRVFVGRDAVMMQAAKRIAPDTTVWATGRIATRMVKRSEEEAD